MDIPGTVEVVVERDLVIPARDGVGLAADVYRPSGEGPFPVLLERTPYEKSAPSRSERTVAVAPPRSRAAVARYFVRNGYAVVYQDCRGRYKSGGRFTKYLSEAEDGYDSLAWLMRQNWCNGRIGTFGLSYAAHTQAALGCLDPPSLAAQFLDCGGFSNAYRSGIRHGGAFDLKQATWAYNNALADAREPLVKAALRAQDIKEWFARMPWRKGHSPLSAAPEYEDYLFADSGGELPRFIAAKAQPGSPDPRPLDPWRPVVDPRRRCRFRAGGSSRRQSRRGFLHTAPALVRPLAQGCRQRRRDGAGCAGLRDGRRIGAMQRRGSARPWWKVAGGRGLAVAADRVDEVLPAFRSQPRPGNAVWRRATA